MICNPRWNYYKFNMRIYVFKFMYRKCVHFSTFFTSAYYYANELIVKHGYRWIPLNRTFDGRQVLQSNSSLHFHLGRLRSSKAKVYLILLQQFCWFPFFSKVFTYICNTFSLTKLSGKVKLVAQLVSVSWLFYGFFCCQIVINCVPSIRRCHCFFFFLLYWNHNFADGRQSGKALYKQLEL